MTNKYGIPHDRTYDQHITSKIEGGEHGSWQAGKDGARVFTPRMSFFSDVHPHDLASYFIEHGGDNLRLNLP